MRRFPRQTGGSNSRTTGAAVPGTGSETGGEVYAQNPPCGLPAIRTFYHPPCPDPKEERRQTIELYRRDYTTITAGILLIDQGDGMFAGFGAGSYGRVVTPPEPGTFGLQTVSATQAAYLRDITISWDPFSRFAVSAAGVRQALQSYSRAWSALLGGQIRIESEPFATVYPIASAIKTVAGINATWTVEPGTTEPSLYYVSAVKESTHKQSPAPLNLYIPPSTNYDVSLQIPNRASNASGGPATPWPGFVFVWTGVITTLIENEVRLTRFRLPSERARNPAPVAAEMA